MTLTQSDAFIALARSVQPMQVAPCETIHHPRLRRFFNRLNQFVMVPYFRLGLGALVGNPFTGYIMVVKTIGRKSGKARYVPVNYAIVDGNVYCLSGWGERAQWYRNLRAQPRVELLMPGGAFGGIAEEVRDPLEALHATRCVLRNGGFAGFFLGFNPHRASDAAIRAKAHGTPVIRIRVSGLANGAADPDGWLWLLSPLVILYLLGKRPRFVFGARRRRDAAKR